MNSRNKYSFDLHRTSPVPDPKIIETKIALYYFSKTSQNKLKYPFKLEKLNPKMEIEEVIEKKKLFIVAFIPPPPPCLAVHIYCDPPVT